MIFIDDESSESNIEVDDPRIIPDNPEACNRREYAPNNGVWVAEEPELSSLAESFEFQPSQHVRFADNPTELDAFMHLFSPGILAKYVYICFPLSAFFVTNK